MNVLTRFVLDHKRLVLGFWLAVTIAAFAAIGPAGKALSQQFGVPGREGFETNQELGAIYGNGGDVAPLVPVVTLPKGKTVDSPGITRQLDAALARVEAALPEARTASYASTHDRAFVSDDGRTTFALVYIPAKGGVAQGQAEARQAQAALGGVTVGGSPVEVTGLDALRASAGENEGDGTGVLLGTLLAALGALLVLLFVFRSFMAIVPLLMALVAIPTTFLLVWPVASLTDVSVIVQFLVALIGLGIAIDYALLVVVRWREERGQPNVTNEAAVRNAMQHAGSAVVFSGTTVAISLLALVAVPLPALRSIGIAGLLIALVSVAVAVTLLPVVLATVGPRLTGRVTAAMPAPAAPGRRGPAWSCATAGSRPWRPPPCWLPLSSPRPRSSSETRAPTRSRKPAPHAPAWRSSRTRASARARSRPSTRSSAQVTPRPSRRRSPRSTAFAARPHPQTGAPTGRRSSRSSRPRTGTHRPAERRSTESAPPLSPAT
jgi:RND superfamily putative drug exporter